MNPKRFPIRRPNTLPAVELEAAREAAETYAKGSRAASTWRAYESDWRLFLDWCHSVDRASLPAEPATVALFLAAQAKLGIAPATLGEAPRRDPLDARQRPPRLAARCTSSR